MRKYFRILRIILKNAYIRDSKIVGFILTNLIFQLAEIVITIVFFNVIFANTKSLGGWGFYEVMFLYIYAKFIFAIHKALFRGGFNLISNRMIRMGDYDFYLTKPVNSLFLASINKPRIYEFVAMIFEIGIAIWAVVVGQLPIGPANVIWFIFLALLSVILIYCLNVITVTPVFWLVKVWSMKEIIARLQAFMRYPAGIFPAYLRVILLGVFPVMAASYFPVKTLLYPPQMTYILYMILITTVFLLIARWLWRIGEKSYGSASS